MRNRRFRPGNRGQDRGRGAGRGDGQDSGNRGDRNQRREGRRGGPRGPRGRDGQGPGGDPGAKAGPGGRRPEKREINDYWSRLLVRSEDNEFLEKAPCPACGRIPARIKGRLGPTLLRKCRACSLVYISPRLATSLRQEMMRREPAPLLSERNLMLRHKMAERMERMHREMPAMPGLTKKSATLLEVGCRWGHFLQLCRPHYRSVEGLEWSKERAAFARERFDLQVSATDIFREPVEGRYNVIAAWDLIEREPHPLEFLRWVHDHLEPSGMLALSTPNHDSLSRRLLGKRWIHYQPSQNLAYYTPATITALLRQAGFTDVKVRTSGLAAFRAGAGGGHKVDRSQEAREPWLDNLRDTEAREASRRAGQSMMGRESALKKAWKRIALAMAAAVTAPGWGDEMRVYARRP